MARRWLMLLVATALGSPAAGQQEPQAAGQGEQPHWSDRLKGIPVGPFQLDIGGSVRLRYEYQNDFNKQRYADERRPGRRTDHFLLHRTRLHFDLHLGEQARAFVQLQDARAYGSNFDENDFVLGCPYWNPLDLRQAYLEWRGIGGTPLGIKVGRQAIYYGDNRIWGPGQWGNVGRYTWDAVKLIAETDLAEVHGIFANRIAYDPHSFDEHDHRLDAYGAYAMVKGLPFTLDLFWVGKRTRPSLVANARGGTVELDTHTVGFYADGTLDSGWDWGGTVARTFGERRAGDGPELDVEAYGLNARLGYTFDHPWKPRVGVEYSLGTGDASPLGGDFETFDGAFGAIDKMYGRINFFSWMNLQDFQATFSCKPLPRTAVRLDYHFFRLDEDEDAWYWCSGRPARRDPSGRAGSTLGQEIDLVARYKATERLSFLGGYAHFFPGSFVERTGESPDADWVFFQTQYSF
ncbi:MAG: alginate export family protein [Candidatus Brocadiia bacterium]